MGSQSWIQLDNWITTSMLEPLVANLHSVALIEDLGENIVFSSSFPSSFSLISVIWEFTCWSLLLPAECIPHREIWEVTQKDLTLYHDVHYQAELLEGWSHISWLCPQHLAWYLDVSTRSLVIMKGTQEWFLQLSAKQQLKISDSLYQRAVKENSLLQNI